MDEKIVHDAAPDDLRRSLEAVSTPAMLDTPLGTLELVDGVPTPRPWSSCTTPWTSYAVLTCF